MSRKPINRPVFSSWWLVCLKLGEFVSAASRCPQIETIRERGRGGGDTKPSSLAELQGVSAQSEHQKDTLLDRFGLRFFILGLADAVCLEAG